MVSGMTSLAEAILLLADNGRGGRFATVDRNAAAVGATLADLALAGRIELAGGEVRTAGGDDPSDDPVTVEVLGAIRSDKPRKPSGWVTKLYWGFPNRVRDSLARRGVLNRRTSKVFKVRSYTAAAPGTEAEVRARLHAAVAAGRTEDAWVAELAALVLALGMERHALPDLPRDEARRGLDAIAADTWTGEAVRQAIRYNRIAILTALIPVFTTIVFVITR